MQSRTASFIGIFRLLDHFVDGFNEIQSMVAELSREEHLARPECVTQRSFAFATKRSDVPLGYRRRVQAAVRPVIVGEASMERLRIRRISQYRVKESLVRRLAVREETAHARIALRERHNVPGGIARQRPPRAAAIRLEPIQSLCVIAVVEPKPRQGSGPRIEQAAPSAEAERGYLRQRQTRRTVWNPGHADELRSGARRDVALNVFVRLDRIVAAAQQYEVVVARRTLERLQQKQQ